jgi:hypothetical protein
MLDFGKARNRKTERTKSVNAQHGLYPAEISGEISTYALFHDKYTTTARLFIPSLVRSEKLLQHSIAPQINANE